MNTPDTKKLEREYEKGFNERFGVGIWDSRATDKETMLRTHRDEGIFSTDVLKYGKNFINHIISSRDTYWKERVKDLEQDFIIFKRPECNVKDFLAQSGDGQLHRLMEINPKEALDTLLDNLK